MTSADGRRHLVLNGEIFNYLELRRELEALGKQFRTRSDTEVLLEAWGVWGERTLPRLAGMFAFAMLDEARGVLVLARDPFAIKPLYYVLDGDRLAFASEIAPLLDLAGVRRAANPDALADFLTRSVNNHTGTTMFADVRELPGAHYAMVTLAGRPLISAERYWSPPASLVHDLPFPSAVARFRALFEDSVRLHLRSDVPVGMLLSGGQDSSSVLAMARHLLGRDAEIHTFSYRGQDGAVDEGPWIDAARQSARAIGHDVRPSADEWAAELGALVESQGEPFASPVIYAQRRLFQRAAEAGVRVVLDGQGSDEYLAGYDRFLSARLASLLHQGHLLRILELARSYASAGAGWRATLGAAAGLRWPAARRTLRPRLARPSLLDPAWQEHHGASTSPMWRPARRDVLREMLTASLAAPSIPWLMRYADRNAMAFSIENRVPFLHVPLVDFVLGLPEDHFIGDDGTGKRILRAAMRGLVPDVIRERRDKIGFDVPVEAWLPRTPGLVTLLEVAMDIPAVRRSYGLPLLNAVRRGESLPRPQAFETWRLVTLAAWTGAFGVTYA